MMFPDHLVSVWGYLGLGFTGVYIGAQHEDQKGRLAG